MRCHPSPLTFDCPHLASSPAGFLEARFLEPYKPLFQLGYSRCA